MNDRAIPFDLNAYLNIRRREINGELSALLVSESLPGRLRDAMGHSLDAGGKRLRPVLCLAAAEAVGERTPAVLRAACALELVHTYSLIHDDLPAMDDDVMRRGKPTCHVAFDEATAILAGDALLTLAFEVLSDPALGSHAGAPVLLSAIRTLSAAAGCRGMIEGQMRDIAAEKTRLDRDALKAMHALKTGALIEAAVRIGALLGGADESRLSALSTYALRIGLAFQVVDDVLNVVGDPAVMGKAAGTDSVREKNTYPNLLGLDASRAFAEDLVADALNALSGFDDRAEPLRALARYIIDRKR